METQNTELMTVREAAEYLRVKENTVRIWVREKKLPALQGKATDLVRLRRADVENFLSEKP